MATFKEEIAFEEALQKIEEIEKSRVEKFKVVIKHKDLTNKPEDYEDIEEDENGKKLGPASLQEELQIRKNFRCQLCGNMPITPIVQCKDCEVMYCGDQCVKNLQKQIEDANALKGNLEESTDGSVQKDNDDAKKQVKKPKNKGKKLPDHFICKNKKCKSGQNFDTVPISRIIKNLINSLEFEHKESGDSLAYPEIIKKNKDDFKDSQKYTCLKGCKHEKELSLNKQDMKEHLVKECPNFEIECSDCYQRYKRSDFHNVEIHDCLKELIKQIEDKTQELNKLLVSAVENKSKQELIQTEIDKLKAKQEQVNVRQKEIKNLKDKKQKINIELLGTNYRYNDSKRLPYIFKKGFVSTLENFNDGKEFDINEPIYIDLSKKKGEDGFTTELKVKFKFNRSIPLLAYSFDIQRTPLDEKKAIENEREPLPQDQIPNNRSYLYIYGLSMKDEKQLQMNYQHFGNLPQIENDPTKCFRWRDCGSVITDRFDLKFSLCYAKEREQFENIKITNLKFYA